MTFENSMRILSCLFAAFPLFAAPDGAKVVSGKATLSPEAARLLVESTDKTILEWDSFSIDSHEQVHFHQFDRHSSVLNRVVGGSESSLLGTLTSNGKVYLVNPNGVLIGPNARIETASFIASSLDILDADFLKDAFQFSGNELGSVVNLGTISCPFGTVALLSRKVKNEGTIEAAEGNVLLAAGSEVLLQLAHEPQVFIRSRSLQFDESLNPYTEAIGASCEMSGLIDVSGEKGGTVYLFGEDVRLLNRTHIEASGTFGGGNVFVGGNREEKSAKYLWASDESTIHADALQQGDGGRVILWAERAAFHYGRIHIRGGPKGGNGGFAEVSGSALQAQGFVDGLAPLGKAGKLLLDPTDVFINASATSGTFSSCVPPVTYNISAANPNNILNTDLQTQLASCNVTISTVGSSGTGTGSITVSSALTWSANTTLTLQAASFISISAAITNTSATPGFTAMAFTANGVGAGSTSGITLTAGLTTNTADVILFGNSSSGTGITISGSGKVTTTSGNISVAGTSTSSTGVNLNNLSPLVSSTGAINVSATSQSSFNNAVNSSSAWTTGTTGTVTFGAPIVDPSNSANVISGCQSTQSSSVIGLNLSAGLFTQGSVIATNQIQGGLTGFAGSVQSSGGGDIKITSETTLGAAGLTTGTITANGTATITLIGIVSNLSRSPSLAGGVLIGSGSVITHNGTGTINIGGLFRSGTGSTGANTHGGAVRINATNSISITQGAALNISGDASLASSNSGALDGVSITGSLSFASGVPTTITFGAPISDGTITIEGCQGSSGAGSSGLCFFGTLTSGASLTTIGSVIARNKILGGTGPGCHGFSFLSLGGTPVLSAAGDVQITASTQSVGTIPAHGVQLQNGTISLTGTGNLTLIGTASANSPGNGVNIGATSIRGLGTGAINIAGAVPTNTAGTGIGVFIRTPNGITGTGNIQIKVSGTSGASGPGSHGVFSFSNWTTGTSGLITFGAPISDGSVTVSGCQGGSGAGSHGLYMGGSFSTLGSVVATNNILSGTGNSSFGLSLLAPFGSSAGGNITLASTSVGSSSGNYGIYIGATLSTSGAGVINLTGIGSSNGSGSSNYGIYLDPNGALSQIAITSSSSVGYGITLTGTPGAGTTLGCSLSSNSVSPISLSGTASTFIQSTSGSIGLGGFFAFGSGTSEIASPCVLLSDFGFSSGPLVFDATIDGAFLFSAGSGNSLSLGGAIGGTTPLTNVTIARDILLTADVPITTLSAGAISLSGSMNGPHALSLTTGGNGTVNISNPMGTSSLASLAVSTDLITLNGLDLTTTGAVSFDSQTVLGTSSISISAGSDISFMSEISGNQPVDLTSSGAVFVGGVIDLSGGTLGADFTVDADLDATFSDLINVSGTTDGGDVSISSTDGSVIVNDILTSGTSNAGGGITLQPSSALSSGSTGQIPVGTLQLNGTFLSTLGAISDGSLFLSPAGKSPEPSVATLFGNSLTENSVTFSCGAFEMGTNEALTIFGDATVYASASATFSDTIALGRISADSSTISLNTRAAIELLAANGTFYTSPSAHMLSRALPGFATAVSPAGSHTGVSGAVKASLIYVPDDLILNFDVNSPPPPPPTPSGPSVQPTPASFIYLLSVANAKFFDLLPLIGRDWQMPYRATFCEQKDLVCQRSVFFHFLTFLLENRLKE